MLQPLLRRLLPRADHFYRILEEQAATVARAATAVATETEVTLAYAEWRRVRDGSGPLAVRMEEALAATYVTPLDREDLYGIAKEFDVLLEAVGTPAGEAAMVGIETFTPDMRALSALVARATSLLEAATALLRTEQYRRIVEHAREIKALEAEAVQVHHAAAARLFWDNAPISATDLLAGTTVLEGFVRAVDRCDECGWALGNLALKHR